MKFNNKYLIGLLLIILSACSGYEPDVTVGPRPDYNTIQVLEKNGYSILVDAINKTGIDLGSSPVTLFAPTNAAFTSLFGQLGVDNINDIDDATLTAILQYHLVSGEVLSSSLTTGAIETLQGEDLHAVVIQDGDDVSININGKAAIVDPDRVSTNGAIHGINQVLTIPSGNLVETLLNDPQGRFTYLAAAVQAAGLESTLSGSTAFTIMAPTNTAFDDIGLDSTTLVSIPATPLADILSFHVISDFVFSQQVPETGKVPTILGSESDGQEELIISDGSIYTWVSGSQTSSASLTSLNILATNGVVHAIDIPLFELTTLFDFIDPNTNTSRTGGDDSAPNAIDNFGTIVEGLNYARLLSISDTSTIFISAGAPDYASFANDDDALAYLEAYTFEGLMSLSDYDNGDRIESIGGQEYYVVTGDGISVIPSPGANYSGNLVGDGFNYDMYNGNAFRFDADFMPIPDISIEDELAAEGYDMMAAALIKTEKVDALNSGDNTFFTVSNAILQGATGLADSTAIADLDPDDSADAAILAALNEVIDNHIVTSGANYFWHIYYELPTFTSASGEEIFFAVNGGDVKIILDPKDPDNSEVLVTDVDYSYANGVIHEVDQLIEY